MSRAKRIGPVLLVTGVWADGSLVRRMFEDGVTPGATLVLVFSVVFAASVIAYLRVVQGQTSPRDAATIKRLTEALSDSTEIIRLSNEACARRSRMRQGEWQ